MCGIAGVLSLQPIDGFRSQVERIVTSQYRRGPDFQAVETIRGCRASSVLGHNRLSIIDLSATGKQPMWDVDRNLCIVFNGEVYNYIELRAELVALGHHFIGSSDTEVLLESFKQWGTDALSRLNGMFAFGLYDRRKERLYLVRDRFGVKPLYYALGRDTLHFASSPDAIAQILGLAPDLAYVSRGIRYGLYDYAAHAPYQGMQALLPGHWMEIAVGAGELTAEMMPFYNLNARTAALVDSLATKPVQQILEELGELLDDSVRIRLRSDVPVAVSLSGGLDSSSVASLAARDCREQLHGFVFGHLQAGDSEGPLAGQLGRMAGIELTFVWPTIDQICLAYEKTLRRKPVRSREGASLPNIWFLRPLTMPASKCSWAVKAATKLSWDTASFKCFISVNSWLKSNIRWRSPSPFRWFPRSLPSVGGGGSRGWPEADYSIVRA